ncbi:MAG TPA: LPS export ABC transporter periplasmic protein LptC [Nitrosomonas sp.]|nr:LPS export ABC transporter periplasmic protein LptC [Nitrosomonas sp.]
MINRPHISFPLIVLVVLGLLTVWLDRVTHPPEHAKDGDLYHTPDYIVEDLSGIRMEYDREILRKFTAHKLFHYLSENVTQMEQVSFISTQPEKPPIHLQADRAEVTNKGENILLRDNVMAIRGTDQDKGKITLITDFLHLIPHQNLVTTNQPVTISRMNTTINGIGLELNNETGIIQLLQQVKAVNRK